MTLIDECDATISDGAAGKLFTLPSDFTEFLGVFLKVNQNKKDMQKQTKTERNKMSCSLKKSFFDLQIEWTNVVLTSRRKRHATSISQEKMV